ncbi:MAG: putative selenocysteine system protein [Promethearchaeota archaeon]
MSSILEKFELIKSSWKNLKKEVPYDGLSKKMLFELSYHIINDVPYRCIKIITKPGEDEAGNYAIFHLPIEKAFITIESAENAMELIILNKKENQLKEIISKFRKQPEDIQRQITKSILVERKIDEVTDLINNKEIVRKIYFAIGETRERAAEIPILKNAPKNDVVQLAIMKWMHAAANLPQDEKFPDAKTKGLVKNFLEIKKWLMNFINFAFTASEKDLMPEPKTTEAE